MPLRSCLLSGADRRFGPLSSRASARLPRQRWPQLSVGKHPTCDPASAFRTAVGPVIAPVVDPSQQFVATVLRPSGELHF
jgi:hypothetical protein